MKLAERDVVQILEYIEYFKYGYQNNKFETTYQNNTPDDTNDECPIGD